MSVSLCLSVSLSALVYGPQFPIYAYSVPAILKGWMDCVLCQGFAFDLPVFFDEGLLKVTGLQAGRVRGVSWGYLSGSLFRRGLWRFCEGEGP